MESLSNLTQRRLLRAISACPQTYPVHQVGSAARTIDLEHGTVGEHQVDERGVEFPRIGDRRVDLPARCDTTVTSRHGVAPCRVAVTSVPN